MSEVVDSQQYLRTVKLTVSGNDLDGLDLSELRIKFSVKRSDTMTPNTADIRVYNLDSKTALKIKKEFTRVELQAGYASNFGIIFQGNIKQVIIGRESATDTFIDIVAGDGDRSYNFSVVKASLDKGSKQIDQVKAAIDTMIPKGVTAGHLGDFPDTELPRGKVMFGAAKDYLRNTAQTTNKTWSIQDEKVTFVGGETYLPGEAVVLTSNTGLIGTPQQTNEGVNIKCLLNPNINISGRVKIDNASIQQVKISIEAITAAAVQGRTVPIIANLDADGVYYVLVLEHTGDTRGQDWYTSLFCLNVDTSVNPQNAVPVSYG